MHCEINKVSTKVPGIVTQPPSNHFGEHREENDYIKTAQIGLFAKNRLVHLYTRIINGKLSNDVK